MGFFNSLSGNWLVAAITVVNAVSMSWFGYDQGVFSGVLISSDFKYWFPETKQANISGITSSCFSLGAFCGAIFAFTLGDKLGRKKSIALGLVANAVGAILQIVAWHLPQMIIGRVINGFGMGLTSSTCPVYQAECSRPSVRGKLVVVQSVCNTAAFCLANWMNYGLYFSGGPLQWRFPLGFQLIFPVFVTIALMFVPESPRWLLLQDRHEEALEIIARLEGKGASIHDEAVTAEFLSIRTAIHHERKDRAPFTDVITFKDKQQNLRRLFLSMGTQFMQQFSGVNALGYYLPTLLQQSVGLDEQTARLMTGVNGTIYLGAALCCILIIDRFGRRKMMLYGATTMGACYLIASMCLRAAQAGEADKKQMGNVTTAMFFLYYFFYGTSFAKVPWVYNSEVNSLGWRTRGAAAATATNWMGGFIVTQFTKVGVDNLRWGFYLMFALFCWAYFPVVFFLYPETSRRTLEDMDELFMSYPGAIVFNKPELTQRRRPQAFKDAEQRRIADGAATEIGGAVLDKKDLENVKSAHMERETADV
ncbi:general substrate transporter [Achaetomium macrosporum]|uniref:General substrate transporter n=1 Tax=Achaetomium macrosporum TaxID=79813 RepID=A0AAN7C9L0_9PEZI|nr:general substrate transporter [Achaetomium macrosporum]